MKIKTSDLKGVALDWAVAQCEGETYPNIVIIVEGDGWEEVYSPSTNWSQGGPIIEREKILLRPLIRDGHELDGQWLAMYDAGNTGSLVQWVDKPWFSRSYSKGQTPLIAAMRCYVASKLGNEVDVPEELL